MSQKKARWGILGVAKINDRLLPSFGRARNLELYGIASRALEKAEAAARAAAIPTAYGSYEALLDDPAIDVVYIPLPNHMHAEWTRRAADRGKHILCEKPLTPSAAEAAELVAYCTGKGVKLMDGFMWPHHPRTAQLRDCLRAGKIGPVRRVTGTFTFRLPLDTANIRLQPAMEGGSLLDVGCYPVYGIRWAMGAEPVRVWAEARFEHDVDVAMNAVLWFADGQTASFDCGFVHPFRQWLEITGENGVITVPDMWVPPVRAVFEMRVEGRENGELVAVEGEDQIQHMLENFSRYVLDNTPVVPAAEEAIKTLRVLDALTRSAREERVVPVQSGQGR
jgi:D-xylose 1-dehydrogenase (NADP+, D-xylono-1,5-lactone-forming)